MMKLPAIFKLEFLYLMQGHGLITKKNRDIISDIIASE